MPKQDMLLLEKKNIPSDEFGDLEPIQVNQNKQDEEEVKQEGKMEMEMDFGSIQSGEENVKENEENLNFDDELFVEDFDDFVIKSDTQHEDRPEINKVKIKNL